MLFRSQKSPDRRYQNMQELIADLKQSLMNPDEDFVVQNDPDMQAGTRMITDSDREQIKRRVVYQDRHYRDYDEREEPIRLRSDAEPVYEEEPEGEEDEEDYDYNPRMEKVTTFLALIGGVVFCVVAVILAVKVFGGRSTGNGESDSPIITEPPSESSGSSSAEEIPYVNMPRVKGKSVEEARNALTDLGIKSEVNYEESDTIQAGEVISADVEEGAEIKVGTTVKLTASAGPQGIPVPSVTGSSYDEANARLTQLGFAVTRVDGYSDEVEEGIVMSQVPSADTEVAKGTNITVTVSLGREKIWVPKLLGLSEQDGIVTAVEAGLKIGEEIAYVYSSEYPEGQICYQSYSNGSYVDPGTVMDIKVSKGPEPNIPEYRYNASIMAPTPEEAPDYEAGGEVSVTLTTDDGQELLNTRTSSFPLAANYAGLTCQGGTITMTYSVTTEGTTTTDPETGETTTTPGETQERSFTRRVEFTLE